MPTILIIEDEAKMRRLLELNLSEDGFKTRPEWAGQRMPLERVERRL